MNVQEIAERYAQAWGSGDLEQIMAMHATETTFHLHLGDETATGRDGVRKTFAVLMASWPGLGIEPRRLIVGDHHWVLDWTLVAATRSGGADGTRIPCVDVVALDDQGLITSKDTWIDQVAAISHGVPT